MPYAYPTNINGSILEFYKYINTQTEGVFALVWLIVIPVIAFIYSQAKGITTARSYTIATAIGLVISIFFTIFGLLSSKFIIITAILFGAGVWWLWLENRQES